MAANIKEKIHFRVRFRSNINEPLQLTTSSAFLCFNNVFVYVKVFTSLKNWNTNKAANRIGQKFVSLI